MDTTDLHDEASEPSSTYQQASPSQHKKLSALELWERDRQAVAYSKAQLAEGDTLVLINYPENCEVFNASGFRIGGNEVRVHSEALLGTGSTKFANLLSEWEQSKCRRRNGFSKGLPNGVKFVIDLTPPNEGDEAVVLTSELSCSMGVRLWHTARHRLNVPADVCGGMDEVAKPAKAKSPKKVHINLIDALTDQDFEPEVRGFKDVANRKDVVVGNNVHDHVVHENDVRKNDVGENEVLAQRVWTNPSQRREAQDLKEAIEASEKEMFNEQELNEALKRSEKEMLNSQGYKSVEDIPEYCPIRHRVGIEKLLQLIEGKDPRIDSAPKVWTLFVLAKYFDCTKVVVDFIVSWVLREPNCHFMEILPEVTLKMGLGLEAAVLARPAFAILVSEHALSKVSRGCGGLPAANLGTNEFGRVREDIDEDTLSGIQEAALNFVARIQSSLSIIGDGEMRWFEELSEYRKLSTFAQWTRNCPIDEVEKESIQAHIAKLASKLGHLVRGRILWCFNQQIMTNQNLEANKNRLAETYLKEYTSDFGADIYNNMAEKEKLMTVFPYKATRHMSFGSDGISNLLFETGGVSDWDIERNKKLAAQHRVQPVWTSTIITMASELNTMIFKAIQKGSFNAGRMPMECFCAPRSLLVGLDYTGYPDGDEMDVIKSRKMYDSVLPAFTFRPEHIEKVAAPNPAWDDDVDEDTDFHKSLVEPRKGNDLRVRFAGDKHEEPRKASAAGVMDLPIRPKDTEGVPLPAKTPSSFDAYVSASHPSGGFKETLLGWTPQVPVDWKIQPESPFFSPKLFTDQVNDKVSDFAERMLSKVNDLDFVVLTDTLLCLNDEEFKFLPMWAGGSNDGTGGVFATMVPEAPAGAGPSGPGPAYHTGYSMASRATTEVEFDGMSMVGVDTSLATENGYSDHIDRRYVLAESASDFHSEVFTDGTEQYGPARFENESEAYVGKGKGRAADADATEPTRHEPERSSTPKPEEQQDDEWDASEEDIPFDYGDEVEEDDGYDDTTMTL